jgi:hypothetical protein
MRIKQTECSILDSKRKETMGAKVGSTSKERSWVEG